MIRDLNAFATVVRTVVVAEDRSVVVTPVTAPKFMVGVSVPSRFSSNDSSPRERDPYILRWRGGILGPSSIKAGYRIQVSNPLAPSYTNGIMELLADPREIRAGNSIVGVEVPALLVTELYPYEGTLKEQDATEVGPVGVALWSNREDHENTGTYESFSGEAPIEFHLELGNNRRLDLGGERYRLTSSITDFEGPRVKFEAIRANA